MLSNYANSSCSISIIFPKGPDAYGWFEVAKLLKKVLIEATKSLRRKQQVTPHICTLKVSGQVSFADVVRGEAANLKSSHLKGWTCQNCESQVVFGAGKESGQLSRASAKGAGKLTYGSKGVG